MRKKILIIAVLLLVFITALIVPGCMTVSEEAISFADKAAENALIALNNGDYENYKKDLDDKMLEAVPEGEFIKFSSYLNNTIGKYVAGSKEVSGSTIQNGMIVIIYGADYTEESNKVTVTIGISEPDEGNYKISSSWFDSPILRETEYK